MIIVIIPISSMSVLIVMLIPYDTMQMNTMKRESLWVVLHSSNGRVSLVQC